MTMAFARVLKGYVKRNKNLRRKVECLLRILRPLLGIADFVCSFPRVALYFRDMIQYLSMDGSERIGIADMRLCLRDRTATTGVDSHYFYQDIWSFRKISRLMPDCHVDVGSRLIYVGMLSTVTRVIFIDIRPMVVPLPNLLSAKGSICRLPFADDSIRSLSCLHVAEHIGLGRYGDPVDPMGTIKATIEFVRVLTKGGNLFFSVPVGRPRVCFNAHRVHHPDRIVEFFNSLQLVEFSGIDDEGRYIENAELARFRNCEYGCGLYWFRKN